MIVHVYLQNLELFSIGQNKYPTCSCLNSNHIEMIIECYKNEAKLDTQTVCMCAQEHQHYKIARICN